MFVDISFFFFVPFLFCRDHEKTIQFGTFLLWFLFWRLKRLKRTLPTAARHVVPFSTFLSDRKLQSKIFTCCIKASGYQKSTNAKKPEYLTVDFVANGEKLISAPILSQLCRTCNRRHLFLYTVFKSSLTYINGPSIPREGGQKWLVINIKIA